MSKQLETLFKEKVQKLLKQRFKSAFFYKVEAGAIGGIPDIIGCVNGFFVALELKTDIGRATELQLWTLDKIRCSGGFAAIVRPSNLDMVLDDLDRF